MIEELRSWIINISTAVVFMVAVEMILPNNSLKKYVKFVMGLILITILINPIIRVFNNGVNIEQYVNSATAYFNEKGYETDLEKYKESSMTNTMNTFKLNLENLCEKKLAERFPNSTYKVEATVGYDNDTDSVSIKSLKVGIKEGTVEKIKKVDISTKGNVEGTEQSLQDEKSRQIISYLDKELNISSNIIEVYKN
jgi:stage III sporulation protein AF